MRRRVLRWNPERRREASGQDRVSLLPATGFPTLQDRHLGETLGSAFSQPPEDNLLEASKHITAHGLFLQSPFKEPLRTQNASSMYSQLPAKPTANNITPQRHQTLPPAQTSSAREALQSFYCQLCQKGYTRMNDYEAHLSSYDHSHKQRLKDMKAMVRDPNAAARARRQEQKAEGVVSIKIGDAAAGATLGGGGFKKGGFKKSGFKSAFVPLDDGAAGTKEVPVKEEPAAKTGMAPKSELVESDTEDEGYEHYDPRKPTD